MAGHHGTLKPLWSLFSLRIENVRQFCPALFAPLIRQGFQNGLIDAVVNVQTMPAFAHPNRRIRQTGGSMRAIHETGLWEKWSEKSG